VRAGYLQQASKEARIRCIDAAQPLAQVEAQLTAHVDAFLSQLTP